MTSTTVIATGDVLGPACCPPITAGALDRESAEILASQMKALTDPARLQLLSLISAQGEICACDLTEPLGLSQPTVSHHLKVLVESGFLRRRQQGKWAYFSVVDDQLREVARAVQPG